MSLAMGGALLLSACGEAAAPATAEIKPTQVAVEATATTLVETATPTSKPPPTRTQQFEGVTQPTFDRSLIPLSERGPYQRGKRTYAIKDESRGGREVSITVWYPAIVQTDAAGARVIKDAAPDMSGAPYPLILSSTKVAWDFSDTLVTNGFTWVSVDKIDTYLHFGAQSINQPLDILFALEQAGSNKLEGLEGVIDAEHAGVTGYSFDGYNALAMSGARVDPQWYLDNCATNPESTTYLSAYSCEPASEWEEFSKLAGSEITTSQDGLWQPMSDERIRAVMPMAGEGWWLFGERGLASVECPVLMLAAINDSLYPENAMIYEHLGTPDKTFITFNDREHMMIGDMKSLDEMAHFMNAFFGYYLQGREEYKQYFSQDFVEQFDDVAWGVQEGN